MKSILQICNKISHPAGTFFLCAVFYVNQIFNHILLCASGMYDVDVDVDFGLDLDRQDNEKDDNSDKGDDDEGSYKGKGEWGVW